MTGLAAPTIQFPVELDAPKHLQRLLARDLPDGSQVQFEFCDVGGLTKSGGIRRAQWRRYFHVEAGVDGARTELTSVTTILDVLAKQALYAWNEDHGARGAIEAQRLGEIPDDLPLDEVIGRVRSLGFGAQAAKAKAAKRGLDIHDALEAWARTGSLPDPAVMDPDHRPYLRGLARALLELDPTPVAVEQLVCSAVHRFAGRYDLRATVDGAEALIDLKTNLAGRGWPEAHVQLPAYALADAECGVPLPDRMLVVGVGPDGVFNVDECCGTPDAFLAVLGAFRAMGKVRNGVETLRRASS